MRTQQDQGLLLVTLVAGSLQALGLERVPILGRNGSGELEAPPQPFTTEAA